MAEDAERPEHPPDAGEATDGASGPPAQSGYRNLWVPLVIVPAVVVGTVVLVFVFFSSIAGQEATLEENLRTMIDGGANERQQAAFSLVRQLRAAAEGREPEWQVGPAFLEEVRRAWDETSPEDLSTRLVLAHVLVQNRDPGALEKLLALLEVPDEADPDGTVRFDTLVALGHLGDPAAAPAVIPFLGHADPGLCVVAAAALQTMPGEPTLEALRGALGAPSLELRATAAISLAHLGDPAGSPLLVDLTGLELYEAVHREDPRKFASARLVRENRIRAVGALAMLGRAEEREALELLADGAEDLEVREAAKRAVRVLSDDGR